MDELIMTLTEKTAYLKGLMEGLSLKKDSDEGKLFNAIINTLDDMAMTVSDMDSELDVINEELDAIGEELTDLEEDLYDEEDEDEDFEDEDEDDSYYSVICPTCHEEIYLDESMLDKGGIKCPACGEELEFDFDEDDCDCGCEDGCDCGCEDCGTKE
ncbi:CD1247 N-terminal domain-containing protein [Acidaminobacterium chupaoyuni]